LLIYSRPPLMEGLEINLSHLLYFDPQNVLEFATD
jgi:hypothetical protein